VPQGFDKIKVKFMGKLNPQGLNSSSKIVFDALKRLF